MKRLFTLLIVLCVSSLAYAQSEVRTRGSGGGQDQPQAEAGKKRVSGRVVDNYGEPLVGASITVINSATKATVGGGITNANGEFDIQVNAGAGQLLRVGYVGYRIQEVSIDAASSGINVSMKEDNLNLDEVVVTAAGIERQKAALGYSTTQLNNQELVNTRRSNPLDAFAGRVAGVQITKSGGGVNASTRILMRGTRSFTQDNQPLFVVDGVPIDNGQRSNSTNGVNQAESGNRFGDINPDDIESINILKGPAAASLYGNRAANGAVIVVTKTGKNSALRGKMEVVFNTGVTFDQVLKLPEIQTQFGSGYGLSNTIFDPFYDQGENFSYGPRYDGSLQVFGPDFRNGVLNGAVAPQNIPFSPAATGDKWLSKFFDTGVTYNNSISVSGGNDRSNFFISFSDLRQNGIIPKDQFQRNTLKLTGQTKFSDKFSATVTVAFNRNSQNTAFSGAVNGTDGPSPYAAALNASTQVDFSSVRDITSGYGTNDTWYGKYYGNPYQTLEGNRFRSNLDRVILSATLSYDPFPFLNITLRLGNDFSFEGRKQTFAKRTYLTNIDNINDYTYRQNYGGRYITNSFYSSQLNSDLIVTFRKQLTPDFNLVALVGNNINQRETNNQTIDASGGLVLTDYYNSANRIGEATPADAVSTIRYYGVYTDITLGFRNYIYLNASLRNDWDSRLPRNNETYLYPQASISFIPTELFNLKDNPYFSYGKVRLSYARVGNSPNNAYLTNTVAFAGAGFPYGSTGGFTINNQLNDPNLKPEFTTSTEIGAELGFLKERLFVDVTYFNSTTTNLINQRSLPGSTGYTVFFTNLGSTKQVGWEILVKGTPVQTKDWNWDLGINLTTTDSRTVSLTEGLQEQGIGSSNTNPAQLFASIAQQFPSLFGTTFTRITAADGSTGILASSVTGAPIQDATFRFLGQVNPKLIVGINTTVRWKGLSLSMVWDIRQGHSIYSGTRQEMLFTGKSTETTQFDRQPVIYPNTYVQTSPGVYAPNTRAITSDDNLFSVSSYRNTAEVGIVSGDNIRWRELNISWTLPKNWLQGTPITGVTLSAICNNVMLFTPKTNKFIDPEQSLFGASSNFQGVEQNSIPTTRSFGFNLKVSF